MLKPRSCPGSPGVACARSRKLPWFLYIRRMRSSPSARSSRCIGDRDGEGSCVQGRGVGSSIVLDWKLSLGCFIAVALQDRDRGWPCDWIYGQSDLLFPFPKWKTSGAQPRPGTVHRTLADKDALLM